MTKTAVEFIEDYLKFKGIIIYDKTIPQVLVGVINQAKEMEKQQIINAYDVSWDANVKNGNDYYNQTYNK
jgi:hypothetical protein